MAAFNKHLNSGLIAGLAAGMVGSFYYGVQPAECGTLVILAITGALLPDIDSDTGRPLELMFEWLSVLLPSIFITRVSPFIGNGLPKLLCFFVGAYLFVRYGVAACVKKMTVHRGILHSIHFAVLAGEITYLLFSGDGHRLFSILAGMTLGLGCLLHLLLDEIASISFTKFGLFSFNRASGSALALYSPHLFNTLFVYTLVMSLGWVVFTGYQPSDIFKKGIYLLRSLR
jgi:membrane-bound metal-dependent hydrolase YbcI (DUF457 family)